MKIGLTSYSMNNYIQSGMMSVCEVMRFAKEKGAEHIELVPFGFTLHDDAKDTFNEPLIAEIRRVSEEIDLPLSNYAVLADLLKPDADARRAEIERLKRHIDVAAKLGLKFMRHDISSFRRPLESNTPTAFEREFPVAAAACQELADYAARFGVTTLVENHGFFVNGSDRIIRLIETVDRENFGMLLDTGNFACVDENCMVAVKKCAPYAKMVHLKDFYIRRADRLTGNGGLFRCDSGCWFSSNSGESMLRGSILAQGDLDIWAILGFIKDSGYDGNVSVEFEGMEDGKIGSETGMNAARYILEHI
ncbi:MAG: sugar phosphate isomerase/epimerase [Clostridia bacterium]|nr:sugar phosphate isomerase/epimerase [Clostridia bacterium]